MRKQLVLTIALSICIAVFCSSCRRGPSPATERPAEPVPKEGKVDVHARRENATGSYTSLRKVASPSGRVYFELSALQEPNPDRSMAMETVACRLVVKNAVDEATLREYTSTATERPCEFLNFYYADGWLDEETIRAADPAVGAADPQYTLYGLNWSSGVIRELGWVSEPPHGMAELGAWAFAVIGHRRFLVAYDSRGKEVRIYEHNVKSTEHTYGYFSGATKNVNLGSAHLVASFPANGQGKHSVDIDDRHLVIKTGDETMNYNAETGAIERQ